MKFIIVILLTAFCACENQDANFQSGNFGCIDDETALQTFRTNYYAYCLNLFRKAASLSQHYLVISLYDIWLTLAAIAEGSDKITQAELFQFLGLPNDPCTREKFYKIATSRIFPDTGYGSVDNKRTLVIDNGVQIESKWNSLIQKHSLLKVVSAPIKSDSRATSKIVQQTIGSETHKLDLSGNSILLNTIDYNALWTTAFADAVVKRSPFYSPTGQRVGSVDLMRIKRNLRIGFAPSINSKVIELPVGVNEEYIMMFAMVVGDDQSVEPALAGAMNYTLFELLSKLQESKQPIEVAIPRFVIDTDMNVKHILEDMGIVNLWKNPEATRFMSTPSAQPSSYIQRTRVTLNNVGIKPTPQESSLPLVANDKDKYWTEFVADRPFMFALFDKETYSCIFGGLYTQPTYPN